ncbi:putative membrane protein [Nitrobacteraceae bacterium AZCC 1564]
METLSLMKEWLVFSTEVSATVIDAIALLVVVVGTIEAAIGGFQLMFSSPTGHEKRAVWLRYARWLVAALTFQLAADIIETSIAPSWDDVGRLAVIAVIRTLLNYFLERDLDEVRDRQREKVAPLGEESRPASPTR